jgi:hypothetical protein
MSLSTSTTSSIPESGNNVRGWSRRSILTALPLPLLAGCSSDPLSAQNYGKLLLESGLDPFASPPPITREQAAAISYASIAVSVAGAQQTMLVLATSAGQTRLWTSSSRIALETASGRIVRTGGLAHNLTNTVFDGQDPLAIGLSNAQATSDFRRLLDYPDKSLFGVAVASRFSAPDPQDIEILGATIKTLHVREACTCPALDWDFTNEFWADTDTGLIWRSLQIIHPDLDAIRIDTLRPPA